MRGFIVSASTSVLSAGILLVSGLRLPLQAQPDISASADSATPITTATVLAAAPKAAEPAACPLPEEIAGPMQHFDAIVFGDEVPGVMTALKLKRELRSRARTHRVALITEGRVTSGIGGHLVRGGLAYLDRNQVPPDLQPQYGTFGRPTPLYQEFLRLGQVNTIALDRFTTADNFRQALTRAGVDVIGDVDLETVQTAGSQVCSFTASGKTYSAQQFIDASQSGELAAASGVEMMQGLEALGFPDSSLSLGLMLELHDVTIDQFKELEAELIRRFFDPYDNSAQRWLNVASGGDPTKRQYLLRSLLDHNQQPKLMYQGTPDSADVRSLAFSILVHGWLDQEYDIQSSGFLFDRANIAILDDRLSFNALLFYADAATAQQLSTSGAEPTAEMLAIAQSIKTLFEKIGVPRVEIMDELYVRNAGQIANPIDELSATLMTAGGLPAAEALGTFGYHLDDRGGIEGLDEQVNSSVLRLLNFSQMPVFNYGFRHTLPVERENLSVLGPASGFGGLGTTAGRIVEFNVGVGEGLAIAVAKAITEDISLQRITNRAVRQALDYAPTLYGYRTESFGAVLALERRFRMIDYEENYLNRAQAFFEQGNYTEASRELSRAITLDPSSARAYYLRGNTYFNQRELDAALADYTEAIRLDAGLMEAYLYRGYLHIYSDRYSQAITDFEQALQRDPAFAEAGFGRALARSFLQNGGADSDWHIAALPWLDQAIRQQPEFAAAYIIRGIAQAESGNQEQARADLEQAIALYQAQGDSDAASSAQGALEKLLN